MYAFSDCLTKRFFLTGTRTTWLCCVCVECGGIHGMSGPCVCGRMCLSLCRDSILPGGWERRFAIGFASVLVLSGYFFRVTGTLRGMMRRPFAAALTQTGAWGVRVFSFFLECFAATACCGSLYILLVCTFLDLFFVRFAPQFV